MSADNWTICPRCKAKVEKAQDDLIERLGTDYGKIPSEEYLELTERAKQPLKPMEATLREDYYIGIRDGQFKCYYEATCTDCAFSYILKTIEEAVS